MLRVYTGLNVQIQYTYVSVRRGGSRLLSFYNACIGAGVFLTVGECNNRSSWGNDMGVYTVVADDIHHGLHGSRAFGILCLQPV